jgi:hypothetical protein
MSYKTELSVGYARLDEDEAIYRSGLSSRIGFDSIRFSIEKLQKPFDFIRFQFDIDLIQKTIRFDTDPAWQSYKKNWTINKLAHFQRDYQQGWQKYKSMSFDIPSIEFFVFFYRHNPGFLITFLSRLNRIESYQKSKKAFDSICI